MNGFAAGLRDTGVRPPSASLCRLAGGCAPSAESSRSFLTPAPAPPLSLSAGLGAAFGFSSLSASLPSFFSLSPAPPTEKPQQNCSCVCSDAFAFCSIEKYCEACVCRSLRSSFRSLSTRRSRWSHSFFMRGKTSTIPVSTCSALRTSMYSLDSRHDISDLRILQYHLKTTLTKSS